MRRFSQRGQMVTLSEINITPLLDLAFVLLIIFVITTPLLEKGLSLSLPKATARQDKPIDPKNVRTISIDASGHYSIKSQPVNFNQLTVRLAQDYRANTNLVIYIRADQDGKYKYVADLIDSCQKNGITRYSLRTDPSPK
jgi:biopolymer transport protein ExbD